MYYDEAIIKKDWIEEIATYRALGKDRDRIEKIIGRAIYSWYSCTIIEDDSLDGYAAYCLKNRIRKGE